jgi:hypothetical protein
LPPTSPSLAALAGSHPLDISSAVKPAGFDAAVPATLGPRRGLLIDLDYALVLNPDGERGPTATGHRTVRIRLITCFRLPDALKS